MSENAPVEGGCNCGAVRYRLAAVPLTAYICHCHLCQKRTGGAFSMALVLPAGAVEIVAGKPDEARSVSANGVTSSRWTCGACLSRLYSEREGSPTIILRAGTLDDTSGFRPVAQIWTSSAIPWALVGGDVLSYAEQPTDYAPLLAAWKARPA